MVRLLAKPTIPTTAGRPCTSTASGDGMLVSTPTVCVEVIIAPAINATPTSRNSWVDHEATPCAT
jgi:hypothetical protein